MAATSRKSRVVADCASEIVEATLRAACAVQDAAEGHAAFAEASAGARRAAIAAVERITSVETSKSVGVQAEAATFSGGD